MHRVLLVFVSLALVMAACSSDDAGPTSPDLEIERRVGFAVVVEERFDGVSIGFNTERDAASGEGFEVGEAVWRIDDGPWNEPPVTCLGRGQRIEIGVTQVQNVERPGLLQERVVWLACLSPEPVSE